MMDTRTDVETCDWKVDFWTPSGHRRTAYLDNITHDRLMAFGTEKHTDDPVVLTWDQTLNRWQASA